MVGSESLKLHCLVALGFLLQAHVLRLVLFVPELICFLLAFWQLTRLFYVFLLCNCYTDMLCKPVCVCADGFFTATWRQGRTKHRQQCDKYTMAGWDSGSS